MNKRQQIQKEATITLLNERFSNCVLNLSPRVGKCKLILDAFKEWSNFKYLIIAPFNSILDSWEEEIIKWEASHLNIKLLNQRSLSTVKLGEYDIICCSEVHTLSESQIGILAALKKQSKIFGETGSLSELTKQELYYKLGLEVKFEYSLEEAIKDQVISDYKIRIIYTTLDDVNKTVESGNKFKKFMTTEKQAYDYYTREFEKHKELGNEKTKMFYAGCRSRLIYSSVNKLNLAKKLIANSNRVLAFTTLISIADKLCNHSYHSKSKEDNLKKFVDCTINKLATVQQISMGVTIPSLKHIVVHQANSGEELLLQKLLRCMNFDKVLGNAIIDIIVIKDTNDELWLQSALQGFNPSKIEYINEQDLKI